jgi:hypothetical protein
MPEFPVRYAEVADYGTDLLVNRLDTALAWMDIAQLANFGTAQKGYQAARHIYDSALRLLMSERISPAATQLRIIDQKLNIVRARLKKAEYL